MSAWGRAQDALGSALWGYEAGYGEQVPGLMAKLGLSYTEVKERCPEFEESILEALASVVGYWTAPTEHSDDLAAPVEP